MKTFETLLVYVLIFIVLCFSVSLNSIFIDAIFKLSVNPTWSSYYYSFLDLHFFDDVKIKNIVLHNKGEIVLPIAFFCVFSPLITIFFLAIIHSLLLGLFNDVNGEYKVKSFEFESISSFNLCVFGIQFIVAFLFSPFIYMPLLNLMGVIFWSHAFINYKGIFKYRSFDEQDKFSKILSSYQTGIFAFFTISWFWIYNFLHLKRHLHLDKAAFYLIHFLLYILAIFLGYYVVKCFDYQIGLNGISRKSILKQIEIKKAIKIELEQEKKNRAKLRNEKKNNKKPNVDEIKEDYKSSEIENGKWNEGLRNFQKAAQKVINFDLIEKLKKEKWLLLSKRNNQNIVIEFLDSKRVKVTNRNNVSTNPFSIGEKDIIKLKLNDESWLTGNYSNDKISGIHSSENGQWSFELVKSSTYEPEILNEYDSTTSKIQQLTEKVLLKFNDSSLVEKKEISNSQNKSVLKVSNYQPNSNVSFEIETTRNDYTYYAIYHYYPINKYGYNLPEYDLDNRRHVFNFKDGINPDFYADLFASALLKKFGRLNLINRSLLVVPASNKNSTERRFMQFAKILCSYTGMTNGYNYLINKNIVRIPSHNGGDRNYNPSDFLEISGNITGKDIIVIDDVRTSGRSSNNIYSFLKTKNPKSITFCYLGRTV